MTSVPLKIGSNNLKTPDTVIDKITDYLAVCRLTLERGHQSHLFCHQPPVSISSRIILSVALEIPSRSRGAEREPILHLTTNTHGSLSLPYSLSKRSISSFTFMPWVSWNLRAG